MPEKREDLIKMAPRLGPFEFNVNEFFRRLFFKKKPDKALAVAERFLKVFREHGISDAQIPRLLPDITLDKLRDAESLLPALTRSVLEQASDLLGIEQTWLEGVSLRIYKQHWCYKIPNRFFEDLEKINLSDTTYPIVAFCSDSKLDFRSEREQPIALCLCEKISEFGEKEIFRFTVYGDGWDWGYWKSRIQLKAMIRVADQKLKIPAVPIYLVSRKELEEIRGGFCVPRVYFKKKPRDISLEDFSLRYSESVKSKESEELPEVLEYIKNYKLE